MPALPDPIRCLQFAAHLVGRHVAPGLQVVRVIVLEAGGRRVADCAVPTGDPNDAPSLAQPDARHGWDFTSGLPKFDGEPVPIRGRKLDVLTVLAEATGPVPIAKLRKAWGDYDAEEGTVRWAVAELRKALIEQFTGLTEPITTTTDGYELTIR